MGDRLEELYAETLFLKARASFAESRIEDMLATMKDALHRFDCPSKGFGTCEICIRAIQALEKFVHGDNNNG